MKMMPVLWFLFACNQDLSLAKVEAVMELQPSPLDLGEVVVGGTTDGELSLIHVSGDSVDIANISLSDSTGFFSWDENIPTVPDGGAAALVIAYTPTEVGYHEATIAVTYNNSSTPTESVHVRGRGVAGEGRVFPSLLDFGVVGPGESESRTLSLVNEGDVALTLSGASFTEDGFSLETSTPLNVGAGETAALTIRYDSESYATVAAELELEVVGVDVGMVALHANDCEAGDPAIYDEDSDGYTSCGGDCDDDDSNAHPGGVETADDTDEDCDGRVDNNTEVYDDDGDGTAEVDGDCNDADPAINDGFDEIAANGVDDDCDGVVDSGEVDLDSDGYGASVDCDDADPSVWPGASESINGADEDCDGVADNGTTAFDDDFDGWSEDSGDCDDTDPTIYPGAIESADYDDDDCDGDVDEGTRYADDDGDGFTEDGGDCDDANPSVNPAMVEVSGNGVDDDCSGGGS